MNNNNKFIQYFRIVSLGSRNPIVTEIPINQLQEHLDNYVYKLTSSGLKLCIPEFAVELYSVPVSNNE